MMNVFHWLALTPAELMAAVMALARAVTFSHTGCQVPSLKRATADRGNWPGRNSGPSPPGEVTAQPR
eukprot:5256209-Alexandrium_andersonii.AAC.1